jgi:glycine oxidase
VGSAAPDAHAVWLDQLTEAERAVLDPGPPPEPERRPDVLVVGGGIVGVATAVACLRAGLGSVALVERQRLGAGASGGAAGLLIPEAHQGTDPEPLVALGRSSLSMWRELEGAWPGGVGLTELDWLGLEPHPPGFAPAPTPDTERLDPGAVRQLVPGLARPVAGVLIRHQARVNPLRAVARLAARLPAVATGVEALGATVRGDRIVAVSTSAGEVHPGAVVFATGGPPALDGLEVPVPWRLVKGHLLAAEPGPVRLPGAVAPLATQLEDGRLISAGTLDPEDASPDPRPEVISSVWSDLRAAFPDLDGHRLSHRWCCFRPMHPDGLAVIDRLPGLANAWITSGHYRTGILMAPATGQALARWVATGRRPAEVAGFGLARFGAPAGGD